MTQPTKPSAGALKAAQAWIGHLRTATRTQDCSVNKMARIIDREIGLAELLDAARPVNWRVRLDKAEGALSKSVVGPLPSHETRLLLREALKFVRAAKKEAYASLKVV